MGRKRCRVSAPGVRAVSCAGHGCGMCRIVRAGAAWRLRPHDLSPWHTVYQQSQRWRKAGVFDVMVPDLREGLRVAQGRRPQPAAAIVDSRLLQSTPDSGTRAGDDGAKRRRGSKVPRAVATLGPLLALPVTAAHEHDRRRSRRWRQTCKRSLATRSHSPTLTKGTRERQRRRMPRPIIGRWQSSNCPKPTKALCCDPSAGAWNGVTPGPRACVAWHGMMRSWPRRLRDCMLSRALF
jgi:transposase